MINRLLRYGAKIVQEDQREYQTRKRIRELFERETNSIHARACKPHSCNDPLTCDKNECFVWQPDKIVSEPYEIKIR